ncbi:hypothetical protein ONS95_007592 [Cadophora gregata]|uniref:uncharacterized protein n=1 Tax=Cadophora gregata TaxID=51156 RepID=UPI0026DD578D|nr:uncharacterized protein ONS95_007592 [Cadophora gregata]KAK0118706.1 hypothetical protein ONS96_011794 [Cadophora gregata f. sp. sojae]KAK0125969.1 hypothetical protein ONS95_007592 [Cadophora gregata]
MGLQIADDEPPHHTGISSSNSATTMNSDGGVESPPSIPPAVPKPSRFRFKDKSKRRSEKRDDRSRSPAERSDRDWARRDRADERQRERHHRHHHRSKRRKASPAKDDPALYDDTHLPNASSSQYVDPEIAFRESLFDAMADDEGAQFWEGVYGQPIHTYPNVKPSPDGELERMTDEEYTAFVRAKMYEKTHQHLIEEKARRDAAKKERERLAKESAKEEREAEKFRRKVEESLKRGQERKSRKAWGDRWEAYIQKWESGKIHTSSIPWPVESGKRADTTKLKEIERFFLNAPTSGQPTEAQLAKVLKVERVRWHPDKIQQKLGGQDVNKDVMQAVTAVFQVIDRMWSEVRATGK